MMARIEWMEQRLQNWARWCLTQGSGALGYSAVQLGSVEATMPRDPYAQAAVPISEIEAAETEELVRRLPVDLQRTVRVWYVTSRGPREALAVLVCAEQTARDRLHRAQRLMAGWLTDRHVRRDAERERVQGLRQRARP